LNRSSTFRKDAFGADDGFAGREFAGADGSSGLRPAPALGNCILYRLEDDETARGLFFIGQHSTRDNFFFEAGTASGFAVKFSA
jgi:hypothetical protein